MIKRLCKIKVIGLLIVMLMQVPILASNQVNLQINGVFQRPSPAEGRPYVTQGTTMVPMAFISESLGQQIEWNSANRQVILDGGKVVLTIGSKNVHVDGKTVVINSAPIIKEGRTYVPLRFVSTALGYEVDYKNNIVNIVTDGEKASIAASPKVDISKIVTGKGYVLYDFEGVDLTEDGVNDYISIATKGSEGRLFVIDGVTGETLANPEIVPGDHGSVIEIKKIQGNYHFLYTAQSVLPWQNLYQWKDGKLISYMGDTLNEKFNIKLASNNEVHVTYPNPKYNKVFAVSDYAYKALHPKIDWYSHRVVTLGNGILEIQREIRMPVITNSGEFEINEKYNWDGSQWVLNQVTYKAYEREFHEK